MNAILLVLALVATQDLEQDVKTLAGEAFEGRETGTAGEEKAARHIVGEMRRAGLEPVLQLFQGHGTTGRNVVAVVHGSTGRRRSSSAPITTTWGATARRSSAGGRQCQRHRGRDRDGAALREKPAKRTIIWSRSAARRWACSGRALRQQPADARDRRRDDQPGHGRALRENLIVFGAGHRRQVQGVPRDSPLKIAYNKDAVGPSDHTVLRPEGHPRGPPLHGRARRLSQAGDTGGEAELRGLRKVADLVEALARRIADAPEKMQFVKPPPSRRCPGPGRAARRTSASCPTTATTARA
jgi:hypothetical protein